MELCVRSGGRQVSGTSCFIVDIALAPSCVRTLLTRQDPFAIDNSRSDGPPGPAPPNTSAGIRPAVYPFGSVENGQKGSDPNRTQSVRRGGTAHHRSSTSRRCHPDSPALCAITIPSLPTDQRSARRTPRPPTLSPPHSDARTIRIGDHRIERDPPPRRAPPALGCMCTFSSHVDSALTRRSGGTRPTAGSPSRHSHPQPCRTSCPCSYVSGHDDSDGQTLSPSFSPNTTQTSTADSPLERSSRGPCGSGGPDPRS